MRNAVVVFGNGNAGKTTLLGYLYASTLSNKEYEKKILDAQKKFGKYYREEERYAYIMSNINERKDFSQDNGGNTKVVHFHPYGDFVLIDTPGNEHAQSQKDLGMFLGDYGIFVVDAPKFLNDTVALEDFSQLILWCTLKGSKNVIIVLSKIDLLCEDQIKDVYKKAEFIFNEEAELDLKIVPIMINRDLGTNSDQNVIHAKTFDFCETIVLKDYIDHVLRIEQNENETKNFCIYAERYFDHTHKQGAGVGRTWRNRILSGNIEKNSLVKILPVKYNKQYTMATAKIKSIKSLQNKLVNFARSGDIVGLDFSELKIENERVDKGEVVSTKGTLIVDQDTTVCLGNTFVLSFDRGDDIIKKFDVNPLEEVYMYWFGKRVLVKVLMKETDDNNVKIVLYQQDIQLIMPIIDGKYLFDKITIDNNKYRDGKNKYYSARLQEIGYIKNIFLKNICDIDMNIKILENHIVESNCQIYHNENLNGITIDMNDVDNVYSVIKDLLCAIDTEKIFGELVFDIECKKC